MAEYIALIHKDGGTDYGVSFPDFPGCVSAGATMDEALRGAEDALALHIEGMREDGEKIPAPSSLDAVMADKDNAGGIAVVVRGPSERAVRVNLSIEEALLTKIDRFVDDTGFPGGRSGLLAEGAKTLIGGMIRLPGGAFMSAPMAMADPAKMPPAVRERMETFNREWRAAEAAERKPTPPRGDARDTVIRASGGDTQTVRSRAGRITFPGGSKGSAKGIQGGKKK